MTMPPAQVEATVDEATAPAAEATGKDIAGRSPGQIAWYRLKHDKVSMAAFIFVVFVTLLAIAAPLLRSLGFLDPYAYHQNLVQGFGSMPSGKFGGISFSHPFGVEPGTGRDVFARVILGVSFSLMIATSATLLSVVLGMTLGIIAGYTGKATDFWLSRLMDLILSFPQLLMLLALSPVLRDRITAAGVPAGTPTSAVFLILVLGFFGWPYLARIIRGQVLTLRNREFVEAARSLGAKRRRVWVKELMPNLWAPLIVYVSLTLPLFISTEAALSYLGVGLQAPTPSLGNILNDSVSYFQPDPAYFYIPGVTLVLIVLAFNMLGDGLRDALDPKSTR